MKKALIASILGVVASVATSYGQGTVFFANYSPSESINAPVTLVPGDIMISGATGWKADLLYQFGAGPWTLAAGSQVGFAGGFDGDTANGAGYFVGSSVTIPGYAGGPISFQVQAYNGADYQGSTGRGLSAILNMPSIATGVQPVTGLIGLTSWTVVIPEPSTFALLGLGSAAMLIFRRRK